MNNTQASAWQVQLKAWRKELRVPEDYHPWRALGMKARGLPSSERVQGLLDLVVTDVILKAQKLEGKKASVNGRSCAWARKAMSDTVVDISQNPGRRPYSCGHIATMCTSSNLFDFGRDAMICPLEMLLLQGHNPLSTSLPPSMKQTSVRSLAGEGIALPCLGLNVLSLLLTKGFPDP